MRRGLLLLPLLAAGCFAPKTAREWDSRAERYVLSGRSRDALHAFQRSLLLDTGNARAWANRGTVLLNLGRPQEALDSYEWALGLGDSSAYLQCSRASALIALKRHEAALEAADKALAADPGYAPGMANKAKALKSLGREAEAFALYARAFSIDPSLKTRFLSPGERWAPEPRVSLLYRAPHPGEALLVAVSSHSEAAPPSGRLGSAPLAFFRASSGTFLALGGIDVEASTGTLAVELELQGQDGARLPWKGAVAVQPKRFPTVELKVEEKYVSLSADDEKRAEREAGLLKEIFSRRTARVLWEGNFLPPIPGASSSRFGERRVFNRVPRAPHTGADLRAKAGTPVLAPAAGSVAFAGELFFSGKTVVLDHGFGLFTQYGHLSEISVKEGETAAKGAVLGKVGATGRATGPHLHWGVRAGEARVDPFSLAALDLAAWLPRRTP